MDESKHKNFQGKYKSGSENPGFVSQDEPNFPCETLELYSDTQSENKNASNIPPVSSKLTDLEPCCTEKSCKINTELDNDIVGNGNESENIITRIVTKGRSEAQRFFFLHKIIIKTCLTVGLVFLYHVYLICAIIYNVNNELPFSWCDGVGLLVVLTGLVYWSLLYYFVFKPILGNKIKKQLLTPYMGKLRTIWGKRYTNSMVCLVCLIGLIAFLILDTKEQPKRLISALGIPILLIAGLILSNYPGRIKWRQVFWSLAIQFVFGLIILRWPPGRHFLDCISNKVKIFLDYSTVGSDFIYGYLSSGKLNDDTAFPPIFVFRGLSVIFFFGFMISLLYHYGMMQWVIVKLGWLLSITIGTTAVESMNTAANIFIGMAEAPLLIKPFINQLTKSELHAIMTGGFATIAGSVMAAYISFGISASYLLSASVMAAPAALGFAKLMYPETSISTTTSKDVKIIQIRSEGNAVDAASQGAIQGVTLVACIVANIIAFVSFVAFLNAIISWFGGLVGYDSLSFEVILGKIFIPIAWIMGVDSEECEQVALLLGLKTVANEFIAYKRLSEISISPRSKAIATYALCSFANIGSVGIQLGSLGAIAPDRRKDIGKIIGRAFLSGTLVGFLNACMAGMLLSEPGFKEWRLSQNSSMVLEI